MQSAKTLRTVSQHPEFELEHPTEQDKPLLKPPSKTEIPTALPRDLNLKPACPHLKTLYLLVVLKMQTLAALPLTSRGDGTL